MASGFVTLLPSPQMEHPCPFATARNAARKTIPLTEIDIIKNGPRSMNCENYGCLEDSFAMCSKKAEIRKDS